MKLMYQSYRASHMNQTSVMMSNIPKIPAIAPKLRMKTGVITKLGSALHQIMVVWQQLTTARPNTHEIQTLRTWKCTQNLERTESSFVHCVSLVFMQRRWIGLQL